MELDFQIDDFGSLPVLRLSSVAELEEMVREAATDGQAAYPVGGGTMLGFGLPPTNRGVVADLRRLDQVIDYAARDMTITVQAGITIAKLQAILAGENQQLPVDVPLPQQATLGGALATNASGPRRYGYGTLRDYVIGISVVNDEGQEVKAGGRVVKNVAGYDMAKLYIGSLGTLGIITQVTLKLRPLPESRAAVEMGCPDEDLDALFDLLHGSRTRPVSLSAQEAGLQQWRVFVGFEDSREAVEWQVRQLEQELGTRFASERLAPEAADRIRGELTDFPVATKAPLTLKVNVMPRATAALCRRLTGFPYVESVAAHAGNGIVFGHADNLTLEQAGTMLAELLDAAAEAQGNVVVFRCPPAWKTVLPVWGRPRNDLQLMRAIKEKLDPRQLFNPGRFVDGI